MHELNCLGEATVRSPAGDLIHFRSRKHFALLVYLALNAERAHRRERLAGLLWSDSEDSKARHSLSQALYAIRRLLDDAVKIEGEDLEFTSDGLWVDAVEMERQLESGSAGAAADLCRGEFLEGFWVRGAQGFEEWAGRERARLAALARHALRHVIRTARDSCDWLEVQRRAMHLIALDPFDETAYAELMRALWMIGDRAAALEHYEQLQSVLARELGSKPSREIKALADRIRERVVRGGWSIHRMRREDERSVFFRPPFVGRKHELAALSQEWHRVSNGASRAAAIVGTAGIGKTRLAAEFLESLELSDVSILKGRCYEAEQSLPYAPVAEALRQGIMKTELGEINPLWLSELARIVPEVQERYAKLPVPPQLDAEGSRRRLYEGMAQVLIAACDARPVLLFVDDLHWADDSSLALLHYLQRRVTSGLYLLTAHRPEELATGHSAMTAGLLSNDNQKVTTIMLDALDHNASSDLLSILINPAEYPTVFASVRDLSAGNPFFAIELARNLAEQDTAKGHVRLSIPDSIRVLFKRRFASLSNRAVALMQQAAVLGSRFSYEVLSTATRLSLLDLDGLTRELARVGILSENAGHISFRHDLIREVALAEIQPALAKALHLRAAYALETRQGDPGEIAAHFSKAGDAQRAFSYALAGAQAAERLFALDEAANLLQLAIQHAPDGQTEVNLAGRLGRLFLYTRDYARARPLLRTHLDHISKNSSHSRIQFFEVRHDLLLVEAYSSTLPLMESGDALKALHSELVECKMDAPRLEADILRSLLWAAARAFRPSLVEEAIDRIRNLHDRTTEPKVRTRTARSLGIYASYKGAATEARNLLQQARCYAEEARDEAALVDSYVGLSALLHRIPDIALANHILMVALPLAEQIADPAQTANLLCNSAVCFMYLRDVDRAESLLSRAMHVLHSTGHHPDTLPSVVFDLGFVAFLKGDNKLAQAKWTDALHAATKHGILPVVLESLASLGILALKNGNVTEGRRLAAKAARLARRGKFLLDQRANFEELLARLRYRSGRKEKAFRGLDRAATSAETSDIPLYFTVQLTRLDILLSEGRMQDAQETRKRINEVARRQQAILWIEETDRLYANAVRRAGNLDSFPRTRGKHSYRFE
jgi:DNA-binding SARP family transcriptional activator/tetratricopeptide (TPR) repeat protein